MAAGLIQDAPSLTTSDGGQAPPNTLPEHGGRGGGDRVLFDPTRFGLLAFLGTVCMLFVGFTSALLLRRTSPDWRALTAPNQLYLNTLVIALSSVSLELTRARLRRFELRSAQRLLELTGLLGCLFVLGQVLAWRVLAAQGVYLASNPSSSFFYILTGLHIVHLAGGLTWLVVLALRARALRVVPGSDAFGLLALYWHFLGLLWLYLLFVLFVL